MKTTTQSGTTTRQASSSSGSSASSSSFTIPWYDFHRGGHLDPGAIIPNHGDENDNDNDSNNKQSDDSPPHTKEDPRLQKGPDKVHTLMEPLAVSSTSTKNIVSLNNILVVVNPYCGKKIAMTVWENTVKPTLESHLIRHQLFLTEHAGHIEEYLLTTENANNIQKWDAILVLGGDGTVSEVINGLVRRSDMTTATAVDAPPIALMPVGTANSAAESFGIRLDDYELWINNFVQRPRTTEIDLGKVTYVGKDDDDDDDNKSTKATIKIRYMYQLAAVGLAVDANVRADKLRWLGVLRYDIGALMEIMSGRKRHYKTTLTVSSTKNNDGDHGNNNNNNNDEIEDEKVIVLEGDYPVTMIESVQYVGASIRLLPYAKCDDGFLDVIFVENRSRLGLLNLFDRVKQNGSHVFEDGVHCYRFTKLTLEALNDEDNDEKSLVVIDGDVQGTMPLSIEVVPKAIRLFVPTMQGAATSNCCGCVIS